MVIPACGVSATAKCHIWHGALGLKNANMASYFGATALDMADKDLRMIKILKNAQDEW